MRNFYTVFNWDQKKIEFGVNVECQNQASIKPAEKAFKSKGKQNEGLKNIIIDQEKDKTKEEKEKSGDEAQKPMTMASKPHKQQTILDKINKSV